MNATANEHADKNCTRSHPHEEMSPMCELRTEIARLNNNIANMEAADKAGGEVVAWIDMENLPIPSGKSCLAYAGPGPTNFNRVPLTRTKSQSAPDGVASKYYELLYAVGMKHSGETRHETALRYIKAAERDSGDAATLKENP